MNKKSILFFLLGAGALALRLGLYAVAVDTRGLLVPFHYLEILLWVLTAAAGAMAALEKRPVTLASSVPGALGAWLLAAGLLAQMVCTQASDMVQLYRIYQVCSVLGAAGAAAIGISYLRKQRPSALGYAAVCVALCLGMLVSYREWSSCPQIQNYVFSLLASVCLTLFCYYQAESCADMKTRKIHGAMGLMALYCCVAALRDGSWMLYGSAAGFLLGELSAGEV